MPTEDHSRHCRGCDNFSYVAHSDVLSQVDVHLIQRPRLLPKKEILLRLPHSQRRTPVMEENAADGMSCIRDSFEAKGIPEEARRNMLQSWRESTRN